MINTNLLNFSRVLGNTNTGYLEKIFNNKPVHILITEKKRNPELIIKLLNHTEVELIEDIFELGSIKHSLMKYCNDDILLESWFSLREVYTYDYIFNISELLSSKELMIKVSYQFIQKNRYLLTHHYNKFYIFRNEIKNHEYSYLLMDIRKSGMDYYILEEAKN